MSVLSPITEGFCTKLTSEFDARMKILNVAESQLDSVINSLHISITDIVGFSPHWAINQFKRLIGTNLDSLVPDLSAFDELIVLANRCVFTSRDSMLSKPTVLARSVLSPVKSNADAALSTLASGIPKEFSAARLVNSLKSQIKTGKLNLIVPQATQILNCMSEICGTNITSRLTSLQGFLSKYCLNGKGQFNIKRLLASQGLGDAQIDAIRRVEEQYQGIMDRIDLAFESGIDRLKDLTADDDELGEDDISIEGFETFGVGEDGFFDEYDEDYIDL